MRIKLLGIVLFILLLTSGFATYGLAELEAEEKTDDGPLPPESEPSYCEMLRNYINELQNQINELEDQIEDNSDKIRGLQKWLEELEARYNFLKKDPDTKPAAAATYINIIYAKNRIKELQQRNQKNIEKISQLQDLIMYYTGLISSLGCSDGFSQR